MKIQQHLECNTAFSLTGLTQTQVNKLLSVVARIKDDDMRAITEAIGKTGDSLKFDLRTRPGRSNPALSNGSIMGDSLVLVDWS